MNVVSGAVQSMNEKVVGPYDNVNKKERDLCDAPRRGVGGAHTQEAYFPSVLCNARGRCGRTHLMVRDAYDKAKQVKQSVNRVKGLLCALDVSAEAETSGAHL